MSKSSISHVRRDPRHIRHTRQAAALITVAALLIISILTATFIQANRLMREPGKQLDMFSSNTLPPFQLVSFTALDGQTTLQGWFFEPNGTPKSTIVLVHDQGRNRLQFGLDSAELYEFLIGQGFCVLAFDLRRSGQSDGDLSAYGYAEWSDVLAAIGYARTSAATRDVLLFGFGSGVTASLLALDKLPQVGTLGNPDLEKNFSDEILRLGIDQSYVTGLILDTPCSSGDEYIRAACRESDYFGSLILQHIVPFAVRFSADSSVKTSLVTLLTKLQTPVYLTASQHARYVSQSSVQTLIDERIRLHPDETTVFLSDGTGYVSGFEQDRENYLANLADWLALRFGS